MQRAFRDAFITYQPAGHTLYTIALVVTAGIFTILLKDTSPEQLPELFGVRIHGPEEDKGGRTERRSDMTRSRIDTYKKRRSPDKPHHLPEAGLHRYSARYRHRLFADQQYGKRPGRQFAHDLLPVDAIYLPVIPVGQAFEMQHHIFSRSRSRRPVGPFLIAEVQSRIF